MGFPGFIGLGFRALGILGVRFQGFGLVALQFMDFVVVLGLQGLYHAKGGGVQQSASIGASIITIGFWGTLYNTYNKEPPKIVLVIRKVPILVVLQHGVGEDI